MMQFQPVCHDCDGCALPSSQDFKYGRELARLMQEAGQHVPPELANCGPGFGGGGARSRYGPPGAHSIRVQMPVLAASTLVACPR